MAYSRCPRPLLVQTFIFSKSEFPHPLDVVDWMAENRVRFDPRALRETGQSYRARQQEPSSFVEGSLRTIRLGKGQSRVQAVVGCPKPWLHDRTQRQRQRRKRRRR